VEQLPECVTVVIPTAVLAAAAVWIGWKVKIRRDGSNEPPRVE